MCPKRDRINKEEDRYNHHQVHSTTNEGPDIRFQRARHTEGIPFSVAPSAVHSRLSCHETPYL